MALSPLVIVSFVPVVEWTTLSVIGKGVLWDVVSPSDDVIDGLAGVNRFYGFLL